jgi:hypothetical protein
MITRLMLLTTKSPSDGKKAEEEKSTGPKRNE